MIVIFQIFLAFKEVFASDILLCFIINICFIIKLTHLADYNNIIMIKDMLIIVTLRNKMVINLVNQPILIFIKTF